MSLPAAGTQVRPAIRHRHKFEGHTGAVRHVIHLPCGQRIITCSMDGSLRVWNLESGKQIGYPWRDGKSGVSAIASSPDGMKLVSGSQDGTMKLWDISTGKVIAKWAGHLSLGAVTSICWGRDGAGKVVSASWDGTAREWDVESGKIILQPIETRIDRLQAVMYSPDMTLIATGGYQYVDLDVVEFIKIWDGKTHKLVTTLKGYTRANCIAWTADGTKLIAGLYDGSIRTWNTTTWKQIATLKKHTDTVKAIALSPNGRILASVSLDHTACLWNFDKGLLISSPFQQAQKLNCVSFSTDGKLLATGCADNIYTWDVPTIVKQADLEDLLSDNVSVQVKSIIDADAMRRPAQPSRDARSKLPQGFFDDAQDYSSSTRSPPRSSAPYSSPGLKLLARFSSFFRHSRRPPRIDVPYTRGLARNINVRRKPTKKPPITENIMILNVASPSQSPNNAQQQSSGAAQDQQSPSQSQVPLATPAAATPTHTPTSATEAPSSPDVVIKRAGRWTHVRLFLCCISAENAANSH